jgi:hypothetical protein
MIYSPFHEPADFGTFDLSTSQVGKVLRFNWDTDVIAEAKVVAVHDKKARKTYTVGDGLAISEDNRTITITLNGADYTSFVGHTMEFACNFFSTGDVEIIFKVQIVRSAL